MDTFCPSSTYAAQTSAGRRSTGDESLACQDRPWVAAGPSCNEHLKTRASLLHACFGHMSNVVGLAPACGRSIMAYICSHLRTPIPHMCMHFACPQAKRARLSAASFFDDPEAKIHGRSCMSRASRSASECLALCL